MIYLKNNQLEPASLVKKSSLYEENIINSNNSQENEGNIETKINNIEKKVEPCIPHQINPNYRPSTFKKSLQQRGRRNNCNILETT